MPIVYFLNRAGRASPRSIAAHVLRHQITVMMSFGTHVIIELLHLPNAYGALGPYIKEGGTTLLQSHLFPSLVTSITLLSISDSKHDQPRSQVSGGDNLWSKIDVDNAP